MELTFDLGANVHRLLTSLYSCFPCALLGSLCSLISSFPLLFSLLFKVVPSTIMSSFLTSSVIGLGGSDCRGLVEQPIMDREVISIGGSSSEDTC